MQLPPDQTKLRRPVADILRQESLQGEQIADLCERAEPMLNDSDNKASYLRQA